MHHTPLSTPFSCEPLSSWMSEIQMHIEAALTEFLPSSKQNLPHSFPSTCLHEAMRYAVLNGGKRIRALLVFASGKLFDTGNDVLYAELIRTACAIEMIHAYSLVHDDMPCMDNDVLRRGKPTVHIQFGEAAALLVGDALQAQAFLILAQGQNNPTCQLEMLQILAQACGSLGMCGGQALDLANIGMNLSQQQLEQMHQLKTGALLSASVLLGALCSLKKPMQQLEKVERAALHRYSNAIGLAFQVVDDILDVTSNSTILGKTPGKDAAYHKPTYVSLLGLAASQLLAENLRKEAHHALEIFSVAQPESHIERLAQLADFIVQRSA